MNEQNEHKYEGDSEQIGQPEESTQATEVSVQKKNSIGREIFEWCYTIVIALVIAFLIKTFLFDVVRVDGHSMDPTLNDNDRLIVTKLGYEPEQGDIVILDSTYKNREAYYDRLEAATGEEYGWFKQLRNYFNLPDGLKKRYYVKRIIALPGQTVDLRNGKVYVDDVLLEEEYYQGLTNSIDSQMMYPYTVPEDCVFVMGDNREHSKDSRSSELGAVPYEAILGKSQIRIYPFRSIGLTK